MRYFLSLILIANAFTAGAQTHKRCYEKVYNVTDVLPKPEGPETVVVALENEIHIPDSLKNRKGNLFMSYVITCNGDVTEVKLIKRGDWDGTVFYEPFEVLVPQIKKIIRRKLRYKPALQEGKPVDFYQILSVLFENGRISLALN